MVVDDSSALPFKDNSFDTVTFVASLNHIPQREDVLKEARRLIKPDGCLAITMLGPILGSIGHRLWWYDENKHRGGMKRGEVGGLAKRDIVRMCEASGFLLQRHKRFGYGMNNLYVFSAQR